MKRNKTNKVKYRYFLYRLDRNAEAIYIVDEANKIIKKKYTDSNDSPIMLTTLYYTLFESIRDICKEISEAEAFSKLL